MILPHPLTCDYSYNQIPAVDFTAPAALLGVVIAALLAFFSCRGLSSRSPRAFGFLLFGMTLAPALAFVTFRGGILAERFLYAPALGFSVVVVYLLTIWARAPLREPRADWQAFLRAPRLIVPAAIICVLYCLKTVSRNPAWRDNMTLFSHDAKTSSNSCQARRHYGSELINASIAEKDPRKKLRLFRDGISQLQAALAIFPRFPDAWFKLGVAYQLVPADYESAILYYNRALQEAPQSPGSAGTYSNLGIIYERLGKEELASYCFNRALTVNPYLPEARSNHLRHLKRTGLDVRSMPAAVDLAPVGKSAADRDSQAMSKILWGL